MDGYRFVPLLGRILIGAPFLMSGLGKLGSYDRTTQMISAAGLAPAPLGWLIAVLIEAGGAVLLLVGFRTRWAALAMAVFTVAAAVFFHRNFADPNQMIHFMENVVMTGGLLYVGYFGAGPLSLDNRNRSK